MSTDSTFSIDREKWANGFTIFAINCAPDLAEGCNTSGHVSPIKRGAVRFEIRFAEAFTETVNCLVYCEYDNIIEIDGERQVSTDFV
jgi:hypothetical protein